jgi:hypothetical protein
MLGPLDYFFWIASFSLEAFVVVYSVVRKDFIRYFFLNLYMLMVALSTVGQYVVIRNYGLSSAQYLYYYYYTESLLTVLMYFAIMHLYQKVFRDMRVSAYIRVATVLLLVGTAWFSYMVVKDNIDHLKSRFVVELGQNMYFVGVVLTYLLWGAVMKTRESRARLVQLILALGIYFSANAAAYALRNIFPSLQEVKMVLPLMGTLLPLAWAYTFTKIPEGTRLATARLVARAR